MEARVVASMCLSVAGAWTVAAASDVKSALSAVQDGARR